MLHPTEVVKWPFKALGKPLGVMREVNQVTAFKHARYNTPKRRRVCLSARLERPSSKGWHLTWAGA